MKKDELKIGLTVSDRWFEDWGFGVIKEILKTRVKIKFQNGELVTYDYPHLQFLNIEK